jgi:hypothetical protein
LKLSAVLSMNFDQDTFFNPEVSRYIDFELSVLVDLLAKHTTEYSRLIANGQFKGEEYTKCRNTIRELQKAIQLRIQLRKQGNNPAEDQD